MGEPGVPTVEEFIASALPEGGTLGFDGRVVAIEEGAALEEAVASKDAKINYSEDLVGEVWADRPRFLKSRLSHSAKNTQVKVQRANLHVSVRL